MVTVVVSSTVPAPAGTVWRRIGTPEGINAELAPWLRMTTPRRLRGATLDTVPVGEPLGRSWLLLFGLLPVDYDDLALAEREPGRRFLERSATLTLRRWEHERTVEAVAVGTSVRDELRFEPRVALRLVPGGDRAAAAVVRALFRHRHRRLGGWALRQRA